MNARELKEIRKSLGLTQAALAELIEVGTRTIQAWEYDQQKVPKTVGEFLKQKLHEKLSDQKTPLITMDVSHKNELSIEEMASFCLKHVDEYEKIPSVKMFIEYHRNQAKAELLEKHIILNSQGE
ncbi:helix-turn-helix domain-containing protein [Aquimarina longa]|uniref:helix-turn-helix domain-containing protein n=1 Tax=Aquimarina longa TaxID=1080221 RepID=UPI00078541EE|nr:helix-turn-helix domain-containing protein [Aquimarina longa]